MFMRENKHIINNKYSCNRFAIKIILIIFKFNINIKRIVTFLEC